MPGSDVPEQLRQRPVCVRAGDYIDLAAVKKIVLETLVGPIKTFYKGLIEGQYAYEKLTVDACLEGSKMKAMQALVLNRTVVNTNVAKELLEDLMDANKDYGYEMK